MSNLRIPTKQKHGRPKTGITKARPSLTINKDVLKLARKHAAKAGLSLSAFIEQAVRQTLAPSEP